MMQPELEETTETTDLEPVSCENPAVIVAAGEEKTRKKPRRFPKWLKMTLIALAVMLGGYILYSVYAVFLTPDRKIQQIYLVPKDAAVILQLSEPIGDWKRFSSSAPWQTLKQSESLAEVAEAVGMLDSVLHNNRRLLGLIGKRDVIVSLHKTRPREWDFLAVADMHKISKMRLLKNQLESIIEMAGMSVTQRKYKDVTVLEMRDPDTRDILYMAFVDNHLVASFSNSLIEAAVDERENPQIGLNSAFIDAEKMVAGKGIFRVYINYAYLPQFLSIYMSSPGAYFDAFTSSMDFAGLFFETAKDKVEVRGYTILNEEPDPYVAALMSSGKQKMKAHEIMPARTAFYANIGFNNPATFIQELERALQEKDKASYDSYRSARSKIEKYFDISLADDFLDWMAGEFAFAELEPSLLGREGELILAIRAKNIKKAKESMALIEKHIRGRTPIKIKNVDYNGFEINYIEMKGFFKLFFGGLFAKFETPYYTYVDDYVVFSNRSSSLLSFVEDNRQKNLMASGVGFKTAYAKASNASTVFAYLDTRRFWPLLQPMVTAQTWADLQANRDVVWSFPQWILQIVADRNTSLQMTMDYLPYEQQEEDVVVVTDLDPEEVDVADTAMNEDAESNRELMNELKRFHVEKFEGNVLREFYENGELRSESEVKDGKRHGRYREFFENGALRLRGKYVGNKPKGTWKYYTDEGKFDRKEKF